jgi:hypothetical protein
MKANKHIRDDIGGAFSVSTQRAAGLPDATEAQTDAQDDDAFDNLYAFPIAPTPVKHHDAQAVKNRLKAKRLYEARLVRLSEELSQLADAIRYLNPLMAETLDEAWEATEDAIEMLSNEHSW